MGHYTSKGYYYYEAWSSFVFPDSWNFLGTSDNYLLGEMFLGLLFITLFRVPILSGDNILVDPFGNETFGFPWKKL